MGSPVGASRQWYISLSGQTSGPYTEQYILTWLSSGRASAETLVSDGGQWMNSAQFLANRQGFPGVTIMPPAPPRLVNLPLQPPPLPQSQPAELVPLPREVKPVPAQIEEPAASEPEIVPEEEDIDADDALAPERDRIVVLGRRQSGKTIFLASIYAKLWKSLDGITAKALSGETHRQLMSVHETLREGQWPASTLGTSQLDLEIDYHGKKRLLVALDFAGELFTKAFVEEQSDWPGVKELVSHIDKAAAVLLLVDPSVVAGMDRDAALEDDFGLVQAVQRIRNWPGGEAVPIVLVLTKTDQYQQLLDRAGGALEFVRKHFPALVRLVKEIPVVQISAVQVEADKSGKQRPRRDSSMINVDSPLRFCLRELDKAEKKVEAARIEDQRRAMQSRLAREDERQHNRSRTMTWLGVGAICVAGCIILFLIFYFNS